MNGSGYETRSPARNTNGERPTTFASILVTPSPTSSTCRSYRPKHESRCCAGGNAAMKSTEQVARARLAPEPSDLARLVAGEHHNPHGILGAHEYGDHTVIRTFRPHATSVVALVGADRFPLQHIDSGLFAAALPFVNLIDYRLEVVYDDGGPQKVPAAYRFLPTLGEVDLHLFNEGRHERLWEVLGAHPRSFTTADGVVDGASVQVGGWPAARGLAAR